MVDEHNAKHATGMPEPGGPGEPGGVLAPNIWQIIEPYSNPTKGRGQILPTKTQNFSPSGITARLNAL